MRIIRDFFHNSQATIFNYKIGRNILSTYY